MFGLPQISMMMTLGWFVFGMKTLPYQQLQRQVSYRHPSSSRVGARPASQYIGPGDETITLSGVLYPEITGGKISLAALEAMAETGKSWPLLEGTGFFYGMFVVEEVAATHNAFFPDGSARRIEFSVKLKRTDDNPSLIGTIGRELMGILGIK